MSEAKAIFDQIAVLAKEERATHPGLYHHQNVDAALEELRVNLRTILAEAGMAATMGNAVTAADYQAKAAHMAGRELMVWEARLAAAKVERAGVDRGRNDNGSASARAQLMGVYPAGRGADVRDAARALQVRLAPIGDRLGEGDESAFADGLADMEEAVAAFKAAIGVARRESRIRISAAKADAAITSHRAAA